MKKGVYILLILLSSQALWSQCEDHNCDPFLSGMTYTQDEIDIGEVGNLDLGWGILAGDLFACTMPAGSWGVSITFPPEYDLTDLSTASVTNGSQFAWSYDEGTRTLTGVTNGTTNFPNEGAINVSVTGVTDTGGNKPLSTGQINIIPDVDGGCTIAFFNGTGQTSNDMLSAGIAVTTATPVELVLFSVKKNKSQAVLSWETATEINNDYFDIERSVDGIHFEAIGRVQGAGTTNESQRYAWTDVQPWVGINYYRLLQMDYDGKSEYSQVRSAGFDQKGGLNGLEVKLYPNPVHDQFTVDADRDDLNGYMIILHNTQGQKIVQSDLVSGMSVDMSAYEAGVYVVQIVDVTGTVIHAERIVRLH